MKLSKELLGLAGEYAVASELCRHEVYAQLTLGRHKQTDILVETETRMLRISVKAKQGNEWPSILGLYRADDFLVLVDLKSKSDTERPDFYVLNLDDWKLLISEERTRKPAIAVDKQNRITYPDGWRGLNIKPGMVRDAKEQWSKITAQILGIG
jgi:hypothetical protein